VLQKTADHAPAQARFRLKPQGTWTYEDWLHFPEDGWKYEIIDGVLYMTPPPAVGHQRSSISLSSRMYAYVMDHELGEVLTAPCGVHLPNQPVPVEPDILFIHKQRLHIVGEKVVEGVPDLIVEILSPSSIGYDRETKFEVYQKAGVPEYWLVDYQKRVIEVFILVDGIYTLLGQYKMGDQLTSKQLPGFEIAIDTIFNF
jgi:Uma2 family endonuclease